MGVLQIIIVLTLFFATVIPCGKHLYKVLNFEETRLNKVFLPIEKFIYKLCGISEEEMGVKSYLINLVLFNTILMIISFVVVMMQKGLFLNPNKIEGMSWHLAFNTVTSFMTNTNLQDYSGESGLSYLSQMIVIIQMMFTSAATGLSIAFAFIRAMAGKKIGNYYVDMVRITVRVLLPLSVIVSLILVSQGVPQTLSANKIVSTIEGRFQDIALGPVAALESIKHIGTNGGGFFGANSSHPFENPNGLTNVIEMLCMMILPGGLVYAFGLMIKNKKQAFVIFGSMLILFIMSITLCYTSEKSGNPALAHIGLSQVMGNMEGKELRFGIAQSTLFSSVTTAFTTGSVDNMHDSLTPLGGLVPLWQMMLNCVFGGDGVGFMNIIMYAILTVFIAGLMVGRTPEFLGKKIEGKEMKLIAFVILIHPLIILLPSALTFILPQDMIGISNSGYHGISQVVYQFTTSAANNGSGFEGLGDSTVYWNVAAGLVMLLGRFPSMIILLIVAGSLASKRCVPNTIGTFKTDNFQFMILLVFIVLIIGALTFLPALALGPVAEHLMLN